MTTKPRLFALCGLCVFCSLCVLGGVLRAQKGAQNGDWRYYGADSGSTKYSPLDRINAANVKNLRIAWRWKADNFGPDPEYNLQATPLAINGTLYVGRYTPERGRHRRRHRRDALDLPPR